jgi:D-serine deaminase-like pyridoxal phosphate-dependent protein
MEKINIGDFIGVLPVHSCLTADVMGSSTEVISGKHHIHMPK